MRAKLLQWLEVKPEVFEDFSYKAYINVLKLNSTSAYYQVNSVNNLIGCQFWVGNRAFTLGNNLISITIGKQICQYHFDSMIFLNSGVG